ncbi:hypothetical protein [Halomarina oriensis]|uniref:Uncharacterized protein n=1 Tax=Halomarina oriensis TaxID=671145 RepID=A0A6B0GMU5_9EURY|nr:hypothetical protein [Halomarina oriensis]MWG36094.1 hypothetical protein [Halomarina oriensis]
MVDLFGTSVPTPLLQAGFSAVTFALGVEYKKWRDNSTQGKQDREDWYNEAQIAIVEVMHLGQRHTLRSDLDFGSISERLNEISGTLSKHASKSPEGVDAESAKEVAELAKLYSVVSAYAEVSEEKPMAEVLSEVLEMLQRLGHEDTDVGEVKEMMEMFGRMDNLPSPDTDDVVDEVEAKSLLEDVPDEILDEGPETVADIKEMPLEGMVNLIEPTVADNILRESMRSYMQIVLLDVSAAMYKRLEKRS